MAAKPVILAVDDDADVLRLVKSDLRQQYGADYRILSADGGEPALDALRQLTGAQGSRRPAGGGSADAGHGRRGFSGTGDSNFTRTASASC